MTEDEFYVSPDDANSRADCPHEIGSDKWLEWQRDFAWKEYTKPSGQERVEAAYQRIQKLGFRIVDNIPNAPYGSSYPTKTHVICITHRLTWFTTEVDGHNIRNHEFQIPYMQNRELTFQTISARILNDPMDVSLTVQIRRYLVRGYCNITNGYIAYDHRLGKKGEEAVYWVQRSYPDTMRLDQELEALSEQ